MTLVLILCVYTLIFAAISLTQINFLKKQREQKAVILDEKAYKEAANIAISNEKFSVFSHLYLFILYAIWLIVGFAWLKDLLIKSNSTLENTLFLLAFLVINFILTMPLSLYESFVKDKKHGFSNMNAKLFIKDSLRNLVLLIVFGFVLVFALVKCLEFLGQLWWVGAFVVAFVAVLIANVIYPVLIAPMYNKMKKLDDEALLNQISALMNKCGFSSKGVFVMDASKRDKRLNAYFGGLFKSKRVVLFDTLLKALNTKELLAVLAHELGHFVHKDILKALLNSALMLFVLFFVFSHLPEFFYTQSHLDGVNAGVFVLLLLFGQVFSLIFSPFVNFLSRKNEFNADKHAAKITSKEDISSALLVLAKENKAFVKTSKLYEFFHLSHPSIDERLQALK